MSQDQDFDVDAELGDLFSDELGGDDADEADLLFGDNTTETDSEPASVSQKASRFVGGVRSRLSLSEHRSRQATTLDARLSSVVDESTPGAALELLRANKAFALGRLNAYVLLLLPTAGDFGGLSAKSRDEDRGTIINLVRADDIHGVVTKELLDDDVLGLIPDATSLDRMGEISLLTQARYLYGVVCEDIDTGDLKIFPVPPASSEEAATGKLYPQAVSVIAGGSSLSEAVDPTLVEAMLRIYRTQGAQALSAAESVVMEFVVTETSSRGYPSPGAVVAALAREFPAVADLAPEQPQSWRQTGKGTTGAASEDSDSASADTTDAADDGLFDNPGGQGEGVGHAAAGAAAAVHDDDDLGFDDGPVQASSGGPEVLGSRAAEELAALREQMAQMMEQLGQSGQGSGKGRGPVEDPGVEPGAQFSYADAVEAMGRHYLNDDLGLYVDPQPFYERLTSTLATVPEPEGTYTPWLGEQASTMVATLNEQLRKMHEDNSAILYRQYMQLADLAVSEITRNFDPEQSPDSEWGAAYAAIQADKEALVSSSAPAKLQAEEQVRTRWRDREEQHVTDAAARARQEFAHRYGARIESEAREAGEDVIRDLESLNVMNLAEFNERRTVAARLAMDESLSEILRNLEPLAAEQRQQETEAFESALAAVQSYIEEHRREDLLQSDVTARKLDADTRYDALVGEVEVQIARAREQADERIEQMRADMRAQEAEHRRQLELRTQTEEFKLTAEQARTAELERQREQQRLDHQAEINDLQRAAQAQITTYKSERDEARAARDADQERQSRMSTAAVVMVVVGFIIMLALGALLGAFVF